MTGEHNPGLEQWGRRKWARENFRAGNASGWPWGWLCNTRIRMGSQSREMEDQTGICFVYFLSFSFCKSKVSYISMGWFEQVGREAESWGRADLPGGHAYGHAFPLPRSRGGSLWPGQVPVCESAGQRIMRSCRAVAGRRVNGWHLCLGRCQCSLNYWPEFE